MRSQVMSLSIPKVLLADARQVAKSSGMKQSQVLRMAITAGMVGLRDRWVEAPQEQESRK